MKKDLHGMIQSKQRIQSNIGTSLTAFAVAEIPLLKNDAFPSAAFTPYWWSLWADWNRKRRAMAGRHF